MFIFLWEHEVVGVGTYIFLWEHEVVGVYIPLGT